MDSFHTALSLLPERLRRDAMNIPYSERREAEEIRLRIHRRAALLRRGREYPFSGETVTAEDLSRILERATNASPYASESLRRGYVTAQGGVRVGFCGEAVCREGRIVQLKNLSSAALRLPGERKGIGERYAANFCSTLIAAPPGGGKTTLLRDLVRALSDGGRRVALCDERGEVSGSVNGDNAFDLGEHTDVICGGGKSEAAMMLLRCMNPQILAMDEITEQSDARSCESASDCGVLLLATAHAADEEELKRRRAIRELLQRGCFRRVLLIEEGFRVREVYL